MSYSAIYSMSNHIFPYLCIQLINTPQGDYGCWKWFWSSLLIEHEFHDRSNPSSERCGKWLTKQDIIQRYSPPAEHVKVVTDFVKAHSVADHHIRVSDFRDKVFVTIPVKDAEAMFDTKFSRYTHKRVAARVVRANKVSYS
jgi:subtilase family serine protease